MEDLLVCLFAFCILPCIYFGLWLLSVIYTFIRNGIMYNKDTAALKLEINNLKNNGEIKKLTDQVSELKPKNEQMEKQLYEKDRIIRELNQLMNENSKQFESLYQSKISVEKQLRDCRDLVSYKDVEYNDLSYRYKDLSRRLKEQTEQVGQVELLAYYLLVLDTDKKLIDSNPLLKKIYTNRNYIYKGQKISVIDQLQTRLLQNKKMTYPGVAELLSQFQVIYDNARSETLSERAYKSADLVKAMRREKKELLTRCTMAESLLNVYEELFPWLEEFKTVDIDDAIEYAKGSSSNEDYEATLRNWLSPEEYAKLSRTEKLQLALERYKKRNKTDWEAGIEYERYVGYLYEKDGYTVKYTGATDGLLDMGRDVLASRDSETLVIQCKRWAKTKTIHEKHIFQIFGTAFVLTVQNPDKTYCPVFYTTTKLSDLAMACADQLGVLVYQEFPMGEYPLIKCNLGHDEFGNREKIYHLPFDQQYDRIKIESQKGEFYAMTIEEAESKGFRKAHKHYAS